MSDFVRVAKVSDIPDPGRKLVEVDERLVVLVHAAGHFYAIDDVCTHDGGPLGEGELDGFAIACPRHGAKFDVRDGRALTMPATKADRSSHEVKVEGDDVLVKLAATRGGHDHGHHRRRGSRSAQAGDRSRAVRQHRRPGPGLPGRRCRRPSDKTDVKIEMTMTSPACPAGPQLISQAKTVVGALEGVGNVEVKVVMMPPWTPDRMTEDARDQLGIF